VFGDFPGGDAFFPRKFDLRQWRTIEKRDYSKSEEDEHPFRISILERKRKYVRQCDLSDFLVRDPSASSWLDAQFLEKAGRFDRLPDEQFVLPMPQA
jgi:hypothetical protein